MNIERMKRLSTLLGEVHQERKSFNITFFFETNACGTVACAVGWAMFDPWFQEQGLTPRTNAVGKGYMAYPVYKGHHGMDAITAFFDIDTGMADDLFTIHGYKTVDVNNPLAVKRKIDELLRVHEIIEAASECMPLVDA